MIGIVTKNIRGNYSNVHMNRIYATQYMQRKYNQRSIEARFLPNILNEDLAD